MLPLARLGAGELREIFSVYVQQLFGVEAQAFHGAHAELGHGPDYDVPTLRKMHTLRQELGRQEREVVARMLEVHSGEERRPACH